MPESGPVPADVLDALTDVCRRVVRSRITGAQDRDDLVQESVARTLGARRRLEDDALVPYGATVARNLTLEHAASRRREHHLLHRLHDPQTSVDPLSRVEAAEERAAVLEAVRALRPPDRVLLVDHVLGGQALIDAAETSGAAGPGAQAARLARARATARVEYVLAVRGQRLPGVLCKQVLVAISAADTRRQRALDVPSHLAECPVCPGLIEPLVRRRSGLVALLPVPLAVWLGRLVGVSHGPAAWAATAGTAAVVVVGGVAVLYHPAGGAPAALVSPGRVPAQAPPATVAAPVRMLGECHFAEASPRLDATCRATVALAVRRISAAHLTRVVVTGMTDPSGEPSANAVLAADRATAVAANLRRLLGPGVVVTTDTRNTRRPPGGTANGQERRATITAAS